MTGEDSVEDLFSRLHRRSGSVRSRQSPSGLETSWPTRSISSPSWWTRSPSSPRGPTTCEPHGRAGAGAPSGDSAAPLSCCLGQDPGAALLHCCVLLPASPWPLPTPALVPPCLSPSFLGPRPASAALLSSYSWTALSLSFQFQLLLASPK